MGLKAHSHCAFFLIMIVILLIANKRLVQDLMEVFTLCDCEQRHQLPGQKQIAVAIRQKIVQYERALTRENQSGC